MANYEVRYNILVNSDGAIAAMNKFSEAISSLNTGVIDKMKALQTEIGAIHGQIVSKLSTKIPLKIGFDPAALKKQYASILEQHNQITAELKTPIALTANADGLLAAQERLASIAASLKYIKENGSIAINAGSKGNGKQQNKASGSKTGAQTKTAAVTSSSAKTSAKKAQVTMAQAVDRFYKSVLGESNYLNPLGKLSPNQRPLPGSWLEQHLRAASQADRSWNSVKRWAAHQAKTGKLDRMSAAGAPKSSDPALQALRMQYAAMEQMSAKQVAKHMSHWAMSESTRRKIAPWQSGVHPKYLTSGVEGKSARQIQVKAGNQTRASLDPAFAPPVQENWPAPPNKGKMLPYRAKTPLRNQFKNPAVSANNSRYGNLPYKILGPTPLPNNGGMALDMLKGMGIMYGISGVGSLVGQIVGQSIEYDNLMTTVRNILESHDDKGNFQGRYAGMSRTIRDVGMKTKFTVSEVAGAAKFLAMAGLDLESINSAIRPISDIALVGDTDLAETADLVTNIMTGYGIAPSRMNWAADVMTNTFTRANVTLPEIAESYHYLAGLLSSEKLPFQEITAALGVLGDIGIKGSQAGTSMRRIALNIVKPRGKKRLDAWEKIGVNRVDENGYMRPLQDIFRELGEKNLKMSDYASLFDVTAAPAASALAQHYQKLIWLTAENAVSGGLARHLAEKRTQNLQGLWKQVESVFVDRGVTAFEGVQGGLRGLLGKALDYMGANDTEEDTTKGDNFRAAMKSAAKNVMEFVHAIIDATKWFMELFNIFGPLFKMWYKFQLLIWPITKAFGAIRGIIQGLLYLTTVPGKIQANFAKGMAVLTSSQGTYVGSNAAMGVMAAGSGLTKADSTNGAYTRKSWGRPFHPKTFKYGLIGTVPNFLASKRSIFSPYSTFNRDMGVFLQTSGAGGLRMTPSQWQLVESENKKGGKIKRPPMNWKQRLSSGSYALAGNTTTAMVMGGLGAYLSMKEATNEEGSAAAAWLYGAGALAPMFGPWGAAAGAGLLLAGGTLDYLNHRSNRQKKIDELAQLNSKWMVNAEGRWVNPEGSKQAQYLELITSKQRDYGAILEANISKLKKQYDLISNPPMPDTAASEEDYVTARDIIEAGGMGAAKQVWKDSLLALQSLGYSVMSDWTIGRGGQAYQFNKSQREGVANLLQAVLHSETPAQKIQGWLARIEQAAIKGEDLNAIASEINASVPNYTMAEMYAELPSDKAGWAPYNNNPAKLDGLKLAKALSAARVKQYFDTGQFSFDTLKKVNAIDWEDAENIMSNWALWHSIVTEQGIPALDYSVAEGSNGWLQTIHFNGKGFVDAEGNMETEAGMRAILDKLNQEYRLIQSKGLYGSKYAGNADWVRYRNQVMYYRNLAQWSLAHNYGDESIDIDKNFKPKGVYYEKINNMWYEVGPDGKKQRLTDAMKIGNAPGQTQDLQAGVSSTLLPHVSAYVSNMLHPSSYEGLSGFTDQYAPSAMPDNFSSFSPSMLKYSVESPEVNINISGPMVNIEKSTGSEEEMKAIASAVQDVVSNLFQNATLGYDPNRTVFSTTS